MWITRQCPMWILSFSKHKFLRNIFSNEEPTAASSSSTKDLKTFYSMFCKFLKIAILLPNALNTYEEFNECFDNENLSNFCYQTCADCDNFEDLKEAIVSVEVKYNAIIKIPKFTLQIYAFVYQRLMDFPTSNSRFVKFETLITLDLFENVHRAINIKTHLHHSHVTGKIHGYAHSFCNMKVRENQRQFSCIAHNFFGFDMFFVLKGIQLSIWETQDLNIGGSGLSNINFASLSSQVKFIDTMKCYLSSLGNLTSTLDDVEKKHVEKLTLQFLNQHDYFSQIWLQLNFAEKRKILDIIVSGKGVIPSEKIKTIDSLSLKTENGFFHKRRISYCPKGMCR